MYSEIQPTHPRDKNCPTCGAHHVSRSLRVGFSDVPSDVPTDVSPEKVGHLANILNQSRRLDELENPRLIPIYRTGKGSDIFVALSRPIIKPDYRKSIDDVNCELTIRLLQASTGAALRLLCTVQHDPLRMGALENEYATWVPRWERSDIYCQLGFLSNISRGFRPWGELPGNITLKFSKTVLSPDGILIDLISASTEPIRKHTVPQSQAWLDLWRSVLLLEVIAE